jgi:hypothetical protein
LKWNEEIKNEIILIKEIKNKKLERKNKIRKEKTISN